MTYTSVSRADFEAEPLTYFRMAGPDHIVTVLDENYKTSCSIGGSLALPEDDIRRLRFCLETMISYLGHQDQDANHEWMVKKMRGALNGEVFDAEVTAFAEEQDR